MGHRVSFAGNVMFSIGRGFQNTVLKRNVGIIKGAGINNRQRENKQNLPPNMFWRTVKRLIERKREITT